VKALTSNDGLACETNCTPLLGLFQGGSWPLGEESLVVAVNNDCKEAPGSGVLEDLDEEGRGEEGAWKDMRDAVERVGHTRAGVCSREPCIMFSWPIDSWWFRNSILLLLKAVRKTTLVMRTEQTMPNSVSLHNVSTYDGQSSQFSSKI
jgi:hypothetical protein